jgi:hypothetical protein
MTYWIEHLKEWRVCDTVLIDWHEPAAPGELRMDPASRETLRVVACTPVGDRFVIYAALMPGRPWAFFGHEGVFWRFDRKINPSIVIHPEPEPA